MPADGGPGLFVRQYLLYGKAWQRVGIVLALIALGVILIVFGSLIGILPGSLGLLIGIRMWGPRFLRSPRFQ